MSGFTVKLFMPSGDPEGLKFVEKSNWIGSGLVLPRSLYAEAKAIPELAQAGVYILVGMGEDSALPMVYVGEGDPVRPRLDQHVKNKDFWTHAVVFTSKDKNLNKAHIQFLESSLIDKATASKRCILDNGNNPTLPSLSSQDKADAELFLSDLLLCMPALGYGFFAPPSVQTKGRIDYHLRARGIEAKGYESSQGFVVRAGSQAAKDEVDSIHAFLSASRADLLARGLLVDYGEYFELTQDYIFPTPSNAAGILLGRSTNGRTSWKTEGGKTLKSIQESEAEE
jgi:hypothetical protein